MRPAPFSVYTTPQFWDDPHISARMLRLHLDPASDRASRRQALVDASVEWIVGTLGLTAGSRVLDLGCGPGLYAHRLARRGVEVLGVDVSRRSIAHAEAVAGAEGLPAHFRHGSYLDTDVGRGHDAALLVFEDYSALSPDQRAHLLSRVLRALRPGGHLVLDVTSAAAFSRWTEGVVTEPDLMDGFWAEPPYTGTKETWTYPDLRLVLERYRIETGGAGDGRGAGREVREFWNWTHCLTAEQVEEELSAAGLEPLGRHRGVAGGDFDAAADSFAVVARCPRRDSNPH